MMQEARPGGAPRPPGGFASVRSAIRSRTASATRRHAHGTPPDTGFAHLLGWTVAGALIPGASLLAAGRRVLGGVLVVGSVAVAATVAVLAATGALDAIGLRLAVRPNALLVLVVGITLAALVWAASLVAGHVLLRRRPLSVAQQATAAGVLTVLVVAVLAPAGLVGHYGLTQRSLLLNVFNTDEHKNTAALRERRVDPWAGIPRINVLLIGSDANDDPEGIGGRRQGTRPDTIIVASVDTASGNTTLFNLPRNLEDVPFPEGTPGRRAFPDGYNCGSECLLNSVWTWGEEHAELFPNDPQPGLTATRHAVSAALGLDLDYHAVIDMQGFIDLVDAMGGVRVQVPRRIPKTEAPAGGGPLPADTGYIEPGLKVLGGQDALWYVRSRADSDNYDRMRRQQCIVGAVLEQADPVSLARAFPTLAASAERNIATDVPLAQLDAFVELTRRVQGGTLRTLPFTNDVITPSNPDYDAVQRIVKQGIAPPPSTPSPATSPARAAAGSPEPSTDDREHQPSASPSTPAAAQDLALACR